MPYQLFYFFDFDQMRTRLLLITICCFALMMASCLQQTGNTSLSEEEKASYLEKGKAIAQASFKALSSQLMKAMQTQGLEGAVTYCNVKALPITDSLSEAYQATISRTTLQPRNPANSPDEAEKALLEAYHATMASGGRPAPQVTTLEDGQVLFTAPIMLKGQCLQCHGTVGQELPEQHYTLIQQLYPEDQATGYSKGDLRGMWSIRFAAEQM